MPVFNCLQIALLKTEEKPLEKTFMNAPIMDWTNFQSDLVK